MNDGVLKTEVWFAPGRANLMGEHTDYNEGFVLPFALAQGVTATAVRRDDGLLVLRSRQAPDETATSLDSLAPGSVTGWAAYPAGVAWALRDAGYADARRLDRHRLRPARGRGVSSSAALECSVALALCSLSGISVPRRELAAIAKRAENEFVGAPTGIIDQSASLLCQDGHALLLDCGTLETPRCRSGPPRLASASSGHRHPGDACAGRQGSTRGGGPSARQAARLLGVPALGASPTLREAGPDRRSRCAPPGRHVITDSARVKAIAAGCSRWSRPARRAKCTAMIGEIAGPKGTRSLRDDFEVSWPAADATVDAAAVEAGATARR